MLTLTDRFTQLAPDAHIGLLALDKVCNPPQAELLELQKQSIESALRLRYSGYERQQLRDLPILQAYYQFYRRFDKTYHVQLQLESILFKNKSIPTVAALVEAMFMAELKNFLLTAGHDLGLINQPVLCDIAQGGEAFTQLNGKEVQLKPGDMYIADVDGILSSVLYGPDQRTAITPRTEQVVFTVYAPAGIDPGLVLAHLDDITAFTRLFAPAASVIQQLVLP